MSVERKLYEIAHKRGKRNAQWTQRNRELVALIEAAREAGATWPAIAERMDMSRQGLEKFLKRNGSGPER